MRRPPKALILALLACFAAACGGGDEATTTGEGGAGSGAAGPTSSGTAGGDDNPSGAGSGGGKAGDDHVYPDIATLHDLGVSRTCSLNQGVCHSEKQYPELGSAQDLLSLVGAPCQHGAQSPGSVLDECEVPGDRLVLGGIDYEILLVQVNDGSPFPPKLVTVKVDKPVASYDTAGGKVRRLDLKSSAELFAKPLDGVQAYNGPDAQRVVLDFTNAVDKSLAQFLDVRAFKGDRVRMGDPNNNGIAHAAATPWAEIWPGDPSRSFLYRRLVSDQYGPTMPLIPRTWSAEATRAVWCWIRGLPPDASPGALSVKMPISYDDCPVDPDAPNPDDKGGWPAVRTLLGSKCATGPCHSASAKAGGLDLVPTDPAAFLKHVVNAQSTQSPGALLVVPGQPAASYLLCKVDPACASKAEGTGLMPLNGTPLDEAEMQTISTWIVNGAKVE